MKTEAIRGAVHRLRAQGHFGLASQVEEELAFLGRCVSALGEMGTTRYGEWHTNACASETQGMWCVCEEEAKHARDALKAVGELP